MGAGCTSPTAPSAVDASELTDPLQKNSDEEGELVSISGMLTLQIPSGCRSDFSGGSTFIVCPSYDNPTPPPDMSISTNDGVINIRRWEDLVWESWDDVIASIRIITPLTQEIQITIQK